MKRKSKLNREIDTAYKWTVRNGCAIAPTWIYQLPKEIKERVDWVVKEQWDYIYGNIRHAH